ncbi:hypothetical protein [Aquimarina hainanensis]|uniref:hypothetical protein n=1 Tax=Aquimarina hainanensis TaxID=1578017 RepID=UPI00360C5497
MIVFRSFPELVYQQYSTASWYSSGMRYHTDSVLLLVSNMEFCFSLYKRYSF